VGKLFAGLGSRFEVHTPTAVAAARGTYFVVWIEEKASQKMGMNEIGTVRPVSFQGIEVAELQAGGTGVANIGNSGNVAFTSGMPPFSPVIITPIAPLGVTGAIAGTEVPDVPQSESPSQVVTAVGGVLPIPGVGPGPILSPPTLPSVPGGVTPPSVISGSGLGAVTGQIIPGAVTVPGVGVCVAGVCLPK
jgi:hypothetical protein